jgi:hypothetical protein
MDQCRDLPSRFDYSTLIYFQRQKDTNKDKCIVHGVRINPLNNEVSAGERTYNCTTNWRSVDFKNFTIDDADHALMIADENGGYAARLAVNKECGRIDISLQDYTYEHDFLFHPFNRYDWGWRVSYTDKSGEILIFNTNIDPYSGGYNVFDNNQ